MSSAVKFEAKTAVDPNAVSRVGTAPEGGDSTPDPGDGAPPDPDSGPIKG